MRNSQPITVTDTQQLRQINTWRRVLGGPSHVLLRLPGINEKESRRWQTRINKELAACGCSEGATFMVAGTLGYVLLVVSQAQRSLITWPTVRTGLSVAIVTGLVGKAVGLVRARARLSSLIRELESVSRGK